MQAHTEAVRPHAVAHEVADLFRVSALAKALSLTVTIDPATPAMLQTDRLKLKQVLSNLLSNAIKFTATGAVALSVAPSDEGGHVLFKVSDTGPGIDPAQHALIFEKFRQADARVSYQHGGTASHMTQQGGGSTRIFSRHHGHFAQNSCRTRRSPRRRPRSGAGCTTSTSSHPGC